MFRRSLLGILALAVVLLAAGREGWAHASLVSAHPASGTILKAAPELLQLQFNEPVSVTAIRLVDASGRLHADLPFEARGDTVLVTPPRDLPEGTQTLSYRIVSADGHPVGGVLQFSIGTAGAAPDPGAVGAGRPQVLWLLRALVYLCVLGGVGGAAFRGWVATAYAGRGLMVTLALGFAVLLASVGVQGLDLLDLGWAGLLDPAPWETAMLTSYGFMAGLAATAILLAAASLNETRPGRLKLQTGAALLILGVAFATTGHASTAAPQWLMRPAVFAHVAAAALWAGALVPLLVLSGCAAPKALPALQRFSSLALGAVAILVCAGTVLAVVQVGTFAALTQTTYGRILLAKLVIVLLLLCLAAANRLLLTPALAQGVSGAGRRLRWSIGAEVALMVLLAGVIAGWRFTPPPRSLTPDLPPMIHLHGERMMVMINLDPGRVGTNHASIEVLDGAYAPFDPRELMVTLVPLDGSIEARDVPARRVSEGIWEISQLYVPLAGNWTVRVGALVSDFERVDMASEFEFKR